MSEALVRKWLGDDGVRRWLFEGNVWERITLAIEEAIREQYGDGNSPPVERLLDPSFLSPLEVQRLQADKREVNARLKGAFLHLSPAFKDAVAGEDLAEDGEPHFPSEAR
ncbi:hypothetical protein [Haloferula helveola]|uniref:hypothetical protein n=1 Tax=Haloferula helveola TaxID=490095 RepID=UPI0030CEF728